VLLLSVLATVMVNKDEYIYKSNIYPERANEVKSTVDGGELFHALIMRCSNKTFITRFSSFCMPRVL